MTQEDISRLCLAERERLLNKYFGTLPTDHALNIEQIGELTKYAETEYKHFLGVLWEQVRGTDGRPLDDLLNKRYNRFSLNKEYVAKISTAVTDAEEITLWERITDSNYRDIEHLNALITAYATDLLAHITADFMEDVKC